MKQEKNNLILGQYDIDIKKLKVISPEVENKLYTEMLKGDHKSRNDLITANLKLVLKIANKYKNNGVPLEELVCEGNKALVIATQSFNPKKKTKFSTYAYFWIEQSIRSSINENNKWNSLSTNNVLNYNDDYNDKDLSVNMDVFEDDNYLVTDILNKINNLSNRESKILKHYFGLNGYGTLNTIELSEKFNISKVRVSNIIENSIRKIRCETLEEILC